MSADDLGLMAALFAGATALAAFFAWRDGNARRDVALMGGTGAALGAAAAVLYAL